MNNLKFNEEKENNGVVRKRITDSVNRRKLSFVGILTGMMLIMIISFTTTAKVFGPAGGAEVQKPTEEPICTTITTTIPVTTAGTSLQTTVTTNEETTTTETTTSLTTTTAEETTESTTTETTVVIVEVPTETETEPETETTTEDNTVEEVVDEEYNDEPESTPEYIVYKPSTHYIHRSTCHWFNSECYEIHSTEGLECRRCTECNPDMEIITPYVEPTQQVVQQPVVTGGAALDYITEVEYIYLCNTVGHEYGSDIVPIYDKACVVATVMNRVRDGGWSNGLPSTIYNVLTAPYQYNPNYATPYYHSCVTQSCKDAVDYYFAHQNEFPNWHSFWGDGRYNYFS